MKIYFKSSNRIKGKVPADQIVSSKSGTHEFPHGAATVVLSNVNNQKPDFKIYFRGATATSSHGYTYPAYSVIADQQFKTATNTYHTYFGQGSCFPMDNLDEVNETIRKVEKIIND